MNVLQMLTRKTYKENIFLNYCKAISKNLEKITQLFQYVKDKVILPSLMTLTQMQAHSFHGNFLQNNMGKKLTLALLKNTPM